MVDLDPARIGISARSGVQKFNPNHGADGRFTSGPGTITVDRPGKSPKVLDVPASRFGMNYRQSVASDATVKRLKDKAQWDAVPSSTFTFGERKLIATEQMLSSKPINRIVSGAEPLKEGYDPHILRLDDYDVVIDGHHRVAMHAGLGNPTMPAKIMDLRTR